VRSLNPELAAAPARRDAWLLHVTDHQRPHEVVSGLNEWPVVCLVTRSLGTTRTLARIVKAYPVYEASDRWDRVIAFPKTGRGLAVLGAVFAFVILWSNSILTIPLKVGP
jgi:hypothetical protein